MAEYASVKVRRFSKPIIEILAGIPTVVYGFFAALTVGPFFRQLGENFGLTVSSESALAAGLIMGIMIIPYISSLSDDVINSVPQSLRDGSYAIGATKSETIKKVVIPAALPGIVGSVLLAVSRAIGETIKHIKLPIGDVHSSVSCRARQTADLAFGGYNNLICKAGRSGRPLLFIRSSFDDWSCS